jgi:N-methylhydantoinase A
MINCRLKAVGQVAKAPLARLSAGDADEARTGSRSVYHGGAHGWIDTPVFDRTRLGSGAVIAGPAVVEEMSSTTVMGPAYRLTVDDFGNLIIRIS